MKRTPLGRAALGAILATLAVLVSITALGPAPAAAQATATGATGATTATAAGPLAADAENAVDPEARAALDRMGAYLRTLQILQVKVDSEREEVLENGLKVQSEWTTHMLARKPDRLLIEVSSDRQERTYFYDGKQFTLWAQRVNFYASEPAPPTIGELVRTLEERFGIEVPLVDLFRWGTAEATNATLTAAVDLGPGSIGDTTCHHYAFRQEGLDWQIWIQEGDYPLPRKLVLTTTTDEARPQFQATYTWDLAPSFNDAAFTFDPPADAHRIVFAKTAPDAGAKP